MRQRRQDDCSSTNHPICGAVVGFRLEKGWTLGRRHIDPEEGGHVIQEGSGLCIIAVAKHIQVNVGCFDRVDAFDDGYRGTVAGSEIIVRTS
jgi:hypothetical protein